MEDKVAKGEARKFAFDRGASGLEEIYYLWPCHWVIGLL